MNNISRILSTSSPDGACIRLLGNKSARAKFYDVDRGNVAFGTTVQIDENGNVVDKQPKNKIFIDYRTRNPAWFVSPSDVGWRQYVYEPKESSFYSRLDCQL